MLLGNECVCGCVGVRACGRACVCGVLPRPEGAGGEARGREGGWGGGGGGVQRAYLMTTLPLRKVFSRILMPLSKLARDVRASCISVGRPALICREQVAFHEQKLILRFTWSLRLLAIIQQSASILWRRLGGRPDLE